METFLGGIVGTAVHACRSSWQISLLGALIFLKDRGAREPVPKAAMEEFLNHTLAFRRNRTVALVHNKRNGLL